MPSQHQFSEEELTHLKKAFDTFDEDRSNTIDANELTKILSLLGREATVGDVLRMIASVDKTNSGVISFDDFLTLMWRRKREKEALEIYRKAFRAFNHNATQKLSAGELKVLMQHLGHDTTQEEVDEMLFEADLDEDHYLSFDEFVEVMQRALVDGVKSPSRRGWNVEHNHAMENWVKVANEIANVVDQSACAKKCVRPARLFRSLQYPRATTHRESGKNIQTLISQCREGDTILLAEGTYTEPFVVHHEGMIIGAQEGAKVIIQVNSKQPAITIRTRYTRIAGITVVNTLGAAISVDQGYCDLENLTVTGAQTGICVRNRSFPSIVGCTISNCSRGAGIHLKESRANVENCFFSNNFDGSVVAERSCSPWISNCVIENGHGSGVVFTEGAIGVVANCKIQGNGTQGIYVDGGSSPIIWRTEVTANKASGAKFVEGARATVEECTFGANGDHDIDTTTEGAPLVIACKFVGGNTTSVYAMNKGGITLERCEFGTYPIAAVHIEDSRAIMIENTFSTNPSVTPNTKAGLTVDSNSTGKATDNIFVGWRPGIHEGRAAMQFANSPSFVFERNVVQETTENAEAEDIVNLLGGGMMRRGTIKAPKPPLRR